MISYFSFVLKALFSGGGILSSPPFFALYPSLFRLSGRCFIRNRERGAHYGLDSVAPVVVVHIKMSVLVGNIARALSYRDYFSIFYVSVNEYEMHCGRG